MGDAMVGVVANPLSGRDIRRLVTRASVFPTAEKANMIQRMLIAFGAVGVHRVLLSTDLGGISASVFRAISQRRGQDSSWPGLASTAMLADTEVDSVLPADPAAPSCAGPSLQLFTFGRQARRVGRGGGHHG